jgi:hypothetical protein
VLVEQTCYLVDYFLDGCGALWEIECEQHKDRNTTDSDILLEMIRVLNVSNEMITFYGLKVFYCLLYMFRANWTHHQQYTVDVMQNYATIWLRILRLVLVYSLHCHWYTVYTPKPDSKYVNRWLHKFCITSTVYSWWWVQLAETCRVSNKKTFNP